jgi:hypothetical protein
MPKITAIPRIILTMSLFASTSIAIEPRQQAREIAAKIRKADYEGDREALRTFYTALNPFVDEKQIGARVHYWRGFAMWRRVVNGVNDGVAREEMESDAKLALAEFQAANAQEPKFVEAKIGSIASLGLLLFLSQKDAAHAPESMSEIGRLTQEARAEAPDNPRLAWVMGPGLWWVGEARGGGQAKANALYENALPAAHRQGTEARDSLEPSWGEPELLMNLAWSHLNRTEPDLAKAEEYARSALALVPNWHYVRDILIDQIAKARAQSTPR